MEFHFDKASKAIWFERLNWTNCGFWKCMLIVYWDIRMGTDNIRISSAFFFFFCFSVADEMAFQM